jgi:hypothetical protein
MGVHKNLPLYPVLGNLNNILFEIYLTKILCACLIPQILYVLVPPSSSSLLWRSLLCILLLFLLLWVLVSHEHLVDRHLQCISEILGLRTLSIVLVLKNKLRKNTTFRKLDLFPSSGEGKKPILLGPLERASLNHWTQSPKTQYLWKLYTIVRIL